MKDVFWLPGPHRAHCAKVPRVAVYVGAKLHGPTSKLSFGLPVLKPRWDNLKGLVSDMSLGLGEQIKQSENVSISKLTCRGATANGTAGV